MGFQVRAAIMTFIFCFSGWALAGKSVPALQTEAAFDSNSSESSSLGGKLTEGTDAKADIRQESEIALNLESNKKATTSDGALFKVLFTIAMVALLGGGAFIFLKKYAVPKGMKSQTQIKVLQQHYLGPKKSLAIVRVAGESILIGVTDQNISMIKSLSLMDDEIPEETPVSFSKMLKRSTSAESKEDGEDFSFGGIKDAVAKRLKGMRDLE